MYKEILFPVDLNHESSWRSVLPVAVEHCKAFGSRLHVLTVVPDVGMGVVAQYFPTDYEEQIMARADQQLHAFINEHVPAGMVVERIVRHGTIYNEILQAAKDIDADMIIMASHRPELSDYLIGPNAARVVRHADRSVLVVRDKTPSS